MIPAASVHQAAFVGDGTVRHVGQALNFVVRPAEKQVRQQVVGMRDFQKRLRRIHISEAVPNSSGTMPRAPHGEAGPPAPCGSVPKRCG